MTDNPLTRAEQTEALAARAGLDEPARALLRPGLTPRDYLDGLTAAGQHVAAVRLLAWALGRREAVWWAGLCAREALDEKDPPAERAAVEAAQKWAAAPTEENRRLAEAAAAAADYGTPGGCAAVAAFWSGGSLAPAKLPAVAPPEHLLPGAVANGVTLAGVKRDPGKAAERYRRFLALGLEVAEGKNRWPEEKPAARPPQPPPRPAPPRPAPGKR
jgi:hypothetical protein